MDSPSGWSRTDDAGSELPWTTPLYQLTTHRILERLIRPSAYKKRNLEGASLKGYPEDSSALRMFSLVHRLPVNFISDRLPGNFLYNFESFRKSPTDDKPEPRGCCNDLDSGLGKNSRRFRRDNTPEAVMDVTENISATSRKTGSKRKTTTQAILSDWTTEKQFLGDDSELALRREIARMNLDVLRRLASMLGEEREKYTAERQMLSASRDMMRAETRKVISERIKLDAERQKVDLEKDVLQSQLLGRNMSPGSGLMVQNPAARVGL